jgi:hypothetical protein
MVMKPETDRLSNLQLRLDSLHSGGGGCTMWDEDVQRYYAFNPLSLRSEISIEGVKEEGLNSQTVWTILASSDHSGFV